MSGELDRRLKEQANAKGIPGLLHG
jgi:hypothetical protein